METANLEDAWKFLLGFIPQSFSTRYNGELGLERLAELLRLMGNPEQGLKVIHVAGTSGKGSTATMISALLQAHGFSVGLHVSPHIVDIRERMQINGGLISESDFCAYLDSIKPFIAVMGAGKWGYPTYFEINLAMAIAVFAGNGVDYAVVETGLGGLLDGTNVLRGRDKICVLTRMGIDHTEILGKSLDLITAQKAGIIHAGNVAIVLKQGEVVRKVVEAKCEEVGAELIWIGEHEHESLKEFVNQKFDFVGKNHSLLGVKLGVKGKFQIENCRLALSVLEFLAIRDGFEWKELLVRKCLQDLQLLARMQEIKYEEGKLMVDGAHNPQKTSALIETLEELYPAVKLTFVVAFKKGKDYAEMLELIAGKAEKIILTSFSVGTQDLQI